jgi:hypothetical protein
MHEHIAHSLFVIMSSQKFQEVGNVDGCQRSNIRIRMINIFKFLYNGTLNSSRANYRNTFFLRLASTYSLGDTTILKKSLFLLYYFLPSNPPRN